VGEFPFTTLEPALGDFYGFIIADIPGLIEGAAQGKGLGHKFLRHIERTKAIVHCISAEIEDPLEAYRVVRNELELYNKSMKGKQEVVVLTKSDMISETDRLKKLKNLKKVSPNVFSVSILDDKLVQELGNHLARNFK
jgi:GTP-binding protein